MINNPDAQTVIVITGMHRSGTSFASSLVQSAGVDIGQRLVEADAGNIKGFFENRDFLEFHEQVLRSHHLNDTGWTLETKIPLQEQHCEQAKSLIAKNSSLPVWGWKDPRTALFLNFWQSLLPNAKFLLIYRSPWEVADSLYRRGDPLFVEHPELAVKVWSHYNQLIVDFYERFSDRCLLVNIESIKSHSSFLIHALNQKFQLSLPEPKIDLYEPSLLQSNASNRHRQALVRYYFPQALDIYQNLNVRATRPKHIALAEPLGIQSPPDAAWAFNDWMKIRRLEGQIKALKANLDSV
jgi:hypothetical protein